MSDDDRLLNLIGAVLVLTLVASLVLLVHVAITVPSQQTTELPDTNWTIQRVNDTHIQITLDRGEPVSASKLIVTVDGRQRRVSWSGRVEPGEAGTLHARTGQRIRLYWTGVEGDRALLEQWRL